jgi:hypothetical protein
VLILLPPLLLYVSCLRRSDIPLVCNHRCLFIVYILFLIMKIACSYCLYVTWSWILATCLSTVKRVLFILKIISVSPMNSCLPRTHSITNPGSTAYHICDTIIFLKWMSIYFCMQQGHSSTETFTPLVSVFKFEWKVRSTLHVFSKDERDSWVFKVALSAELHLIVPDTHLGRMNMNMNIAYW